MDRKTRTIYPLPPPLDLTRDSVLNYQDIARRYKLLKKAEIKIQLKRCDNNLKDADIRLNINKDGSSYE